MFRAPDGGPAPSTSSSASPACSGSSRSAPRRCASRRRSARGTPRCRALAPGGQLHPLLDESFREVALPDEGVLLTRRPRRGARRAPRATRSPSSCSKGRGPCASCAVAGLVDELIGVSAYMDLDALGRLLGEPRLGDLGLPGASTRPRSTPRCTASRRCPASPASACAARWSRLFRDEITGRMAVMTVVLAALRLAHRRAAWSTTARASRSPSAPTSSAHARHRLHPRARCPRCSSASSALQVVAAIPLGWVLGRLARRRAWRAGLATEAYRFPVVVEPRTYAWAALVVAVAAALSALGVRRQHRRHRSRRGAEDEGVRARP